MTKNVQKVFFLFAATAMILAVVLWYTGLDGNAVKFSVFLFLLAVTTSYLVAGALNTWFDFLRDWRDMRDYGHVRDRSES